MIDELKMGNVVKVRVRNGLSTLRLSDNNLSSTSHGPVLPDRAGHLYKDLTSYKVSSVDYVYIVGKARVYVAELNCATKTASGKCVLYRYSVKCQVGLMQRLLMAHTISEREDQALC